MKIICIGGALIDETYSCLETPQMSTSNPSTYYRSAGGVAHNVAQHLSQLGNSVELITHIGNDSDGKWLTEQCEEVGIGLNHAVVNDKPTGKYVAILDPHGNLFAGAAAMHFEIITEAYLRSKSAFLKNASIIQADCNLNIETLEWLIDFSRNENIPCVIDPVSVSKAKKLKLVNLKDILLITPNTDELASITNETEEQKMIDSLLHRGVKNLWLRKGDAGSELISEIETLNFPASEIEIEDVTGAGDAALAGWIHYFLKGKSMVECVRAGHAMAELILKTKGGTISNLTSGILEEKIDSLITIK
jgi:pseudouridine kinase